MDNLNYKRRNTRNNSSNIVVKVGVNLFKCSLNISSKLFSLLLPPISSTPPPPRSSFALILPYPLLRIIPYLPPIFAWTMEKRKSKKFFGKLKFCYTSFKYEDNFTENSYKKNKKLSMYRENYK